MAQINLNDFETYRKIRFTDGREHTAGLVIAESKFRKMTIEQISRLFPMSEAMRMRTLQVSPEYPTKEDAFEHEFAE